jgi:hypothetical protein
MEEYIHREAFVKKTNFQLNMAIWNVVAYAP